MGHRGCCSASTARHQVHPTFTAPMARMALTAPPPSHHCRPLDLLWKLARIGTRPHDPFVWPIQSRPIQSRPIQSYPIKSCPIHNCPPIPLSAPVYAQILLLFPCTRLSRISLYLPSSRLPTWARFTAVKIPTDCPFPSLFAPLPAFSPPCRKPHPAFSPSLPLAHLLGHTRPYRCSPPSDADHAPHGRPYPPFHRPQGSG